jgi:hypothetical protein
MWIDEIINKLRTLLLKRHECICTPICTHKLKTDLSNVASTGEKPSSLSIFEFESAEVR